MRRREFGANRRNFTHQITNCNAPASHVLYFSVTFQPQIILEI